MKSEKPRLDESKAVDFIGKCILLGVTYLDHEEKLIGQRQWFGTITAFDNERGIKIELQGSDVRVAYLPICAGLSQRSREPIDFDPLGRDC